MSVCCVFLTMVKVNKLSFQTSTIIKTRTMNTDIQPPEGKKCFSGIPEAHFIDDVDTYMKGNDSAEAKIKELDEVKGRSCRSECELYCSNSIYVLQAHQKYKFMESNLVSRRKRLKTQVPDIKSSLVMIKKLREKKSEDESMDTQFMLSDQVNLLFQYLALLKADFLNRFMRKPQSRPLTRCACGSGPM